MKKALGQSERHRQRQKAVSLDHAEKGSKIIELKRNPLMAAHFRTKQVKLGTDEIQYVNM